MSYSPPAFLKNSTLEYMSASAYFLDAYKKTNDELCSTKHELESKTKDLQNLLTKVNSVADSTSAIKSENKILRGAIEKLRKEVQEKNNSIEALNDKNEEAIKANYALGSVIDTIQKERDILYSKLEAEYETTNKLRVNYESVTSDVDSRRETLVQKHNELEHNVQEMATKIEEQNILITQLKTKLSQLNLSIETMQEEKSILTKEVSNFKRGEDSLQSLLLLKEEEIQQLKNDIDNLKTSFQEDKSNLQSNYSKECKELGEEYQNQVEIFQKEYHIENEALKNELNKANKEIDNLSRAVRTKIKENKENTQQLETLKEEKGNLEKTIVSLNNIIKVFTS